MTVPDAHLLRAMRWAHARIHVEHNAPWRAAVVYEVDPLAGQVGKSREVRRCREPLSFEAAHLARRCCTALRRFGISCVCWAGLQRDLLRAGFFAPESNA